MHALSIEQTDAGDSALALTGADFKRDQPMLAKISGGYQADLSDVAVSKASTLAANLAVQSLQVSAPVASRVGWNALGSIGSMLMGIAQTDSGLVQLRTARWTGGTGLADLFTPTLGVSGARHGIEVLDSVPLKEIRAAEPVHERHLRAIERSMGLRTKGQPNATTT